MLVTSLAQHVDQDRDKCFELPDCHRAAAACKPLGRTAFEPPDRGSPVLLVFGGLLHVAHVAQFHARFGATEVRQEVRVVLHCQADVGERAADKVGRRLAIASDGEDAADAALLFVGEVVVLAGMTLRTRVGVSVAVSATSDSNIDT